MSRLKERIAPVDTGRVVLDVEPLPPDEELGVLEVLLKLALHRRAVGRGDRHAAASADRTVLRIGQRARGIAVAQRRCRAEQEIDARVQNVGHVVAGDVERDAQAERARVGIGRLDGRVDDRARDCGIVRLRS